MRLLRQAEILGAVGAPAKVGSSCKPTSILEFASAGDGERTAVSTSAISGRRRRRKRIEAL